jgi:PelA/Pel-15E family pectate lyase
MRTHLCLLLLATAATVSASGATPDRTEPTSPPTESASPKAAQGSIVNLWAQKPSDADLRAAARARGTNPNRPTPWWREISRKPDSFYRSEEGRRIAENILSWQYQGSGWPLMNTTRERNSGDPSQAGPWGARAALIKATVNEMRFLARGYRATQDERYKKAVIGGLNFILSAQYPSGGWPHSYPVRKNDYSRYATFNDDMMPDLMTLLQEVVTAPEFAMVGDENRARARQANEKGVDFILKTQIRTNGRLTAWAQQYDEVTYEPKPARVFEPVAISGGESASVLAYLMSLKKPSPQVIESIEAGVKWYHDAQIDGLRLTQTADDRVATADATAPPIWARYYDIQTGRPIFVGRDGVLRDRLADIDQERRGGYAWYNYGGTNVFERYAAWKHERKWDAQPPTNIDESRAGTYVLPDLLTSVDGTRIRTAKQWETRRRPEIMRLLAEYQEGITPGDGPKPVFEVIERDAVGMGGLSRRTQVRIKFEGDTTGIVMRVLINVPAQAKGPVPTLLYLSFMPNIQIQDEPGIDEGMAWSATLKARVPDREATKVGTFNARSFIERGYGLATIYYGDIYPDFDHGNAYGVPRLFGSAPDSRTASEWGAIGAWAWGLSRVMDYLETDSQIDRKRVAVAGVSRLGKATLWAAAQDQRFAAVVPWLSGEGGAAISRRFYGETVADLTNPTRYDYWFAPRYADYAFNVAALPVDGHMLLAMSAPRPVLQIVGTKDTWSDPRGEFVAAQAAKAVWELYGESTTASAYPAPDQPALGDMSFLLHEGEHTTLPIDYRVIADFLDLHFDKSAT